MIKGKEQCLLPEYILRFLEKLYLGIVPEDYGQRMVSRKLLSKMKALYHFYNDKIPSNFGRLLCPEYLIEFIEKLDLIEYTDEDPGFIKDVPVGALKYAFINAWGGMSYKSENLILLNDVAETTTGGITYKVENGVITFITGTAGSEGMSITFDLINPLPSGTYYYKNFGSGTRNIGIRLSDNSTVWGSNSGASYNITSSIIRIYFYFGGGDSVSNEVYKPMLIIGTTAPTEWKQGFNNIRDSAVTSFTSTESSYAFIATVSVPDEVKDLPGYGWGVSDSVFNYVYYDTDEKKWLFVQKVGRVDLGTLSWAINNIGVSPSVFVSSEINDCKLVEPTVLANILNAKYNVDTRNRIAGATTDKTIGIGAYNEAGNKVYIYDSLYTDKDTFKTAISGVYLYYELADPIVTDITDLMPSNFGYIEVRPEGKIIFNNEYEQAVPSAITYLVEVE